MAATQQAVSKYRVMGPLVSGVPYLKRFRATQAMFDREVEIRMPAVDPPAPADPLFLLELDELVGLDHAAFLPVLDRGGTEARGYYVVPYREDPSLESLIKDPGYGFEARCQTIRQLARALAALHEKGIVLAALSPALIAVQKEKGTAWFVHHRFPVVPPPAGNLLPPDCQLGARPTPRTDVFRWACLAYTLFSRGASNPYESKAGEISGFHRHVPEFPQAVVDVMEECLASTPQTRPAHAGELVAKLDARWATLSEMTVSPAMTAPPEPPPPPAEPAEPAEAPAPPRRSAAIPRPAPPADWSRLGAMVSAAALGVLVAWGLAPAPGVGASGEGPMPPAPPPATRPAQGPVDLEPARAKALREDSRLVRLLEPAPTSAATFVARWEILRQLAMGKDVPPALADPQAIVDARKTWRADPEAGCRALDLLRRRIGDELGVAGS